jgi:hypothetical protein
MIKYVRNTDVIGIIIPNNWDENGRVVQIAIYTDTEDVYLVEHNRQEKELLNHLKKRVAVKGKIVEENEGKKLIVVNNFSVRP